MVAKLARVIFFTRNMPEMTAFYGDVLGLPSKLDPKYPASEWIEFDAGGCRIALHAAGPDASPLHRDGRNDPHKIAFFCDDIPAERERLIARGVPMDKANRFGDLKLCDGADPDGNRFQLSNRT